MRVRSTKSTEAVEFEIIIALAGPAAQRRYNKRSWRTYHGSDDDRQVWKLATDKFPESSDKTLSACIRWLKLRTQDLIETNWPAVEKVAHALMEHGTLSGDDIKRVLRPDLPTLMLPPLDKRTREGIKRAKESASVATARKSGKR